MRCRFCGSTSIHQDQQHETFSTKKAVVGALAVGPVGAAAGLIGKNINGYRCSQCGNFMDQPMEFATELGINSAIRDAEAGRNTSLFDYYKKQYPNIMATIPQKQKAMQNVVTVLNQDQSKSINLNNLDENNESIKNVYRYLMWNSACPVQIENIIISTDGSDDSLSLIAFNQGQGTIRSVYLQVIVKDDTGDTCNTVQCVYQGMSIESGKYLPENKKFSLGTDLAYQVELNIEKIALDDGTVWRASDEDQWIRIKPQVLLTKENFPLLKYARENIDNIARISEEDELYLPSVESDYWQCVCGLTVNNGCNCSKCGADVDKVVSYMSQKNLSEIEHREVRDRAKRRADSMKMIHNNAKSAKLEKIYVEAIAQQNSDTEESLNSAIELFESISDYKDSTNKIQECKDRIPNLKKEIEKKRLQEEKEKKEKEEQERKEEAIRSEKKKKTKKIIIITSSIAIACLAVFMLVTKVFIPNSKYNSAVELMDSGKYEEAITAFNALNGYKDSEERINECKYDKAINLMKSEDYDSAITEFEKLDGYEDSKEQILACQYNMAVLNYNDHMYYAAYTQFSDISDYGDSNTYISKILEAYPLFKASIGDTITWGNYEQDNNKSDGKEHVEWIVLDVNDANMYVVSKYILDCHKYNDKREEVTWETCSCRKWLNDTFYNTIFNDDEKKIVTLSNLTAESNPEFNTSGGRNTEDYLFLLGLNDAKKAFAPDYLNDQSGLNCKATNYAIAQGVLHQEDNYGGWALRTPGYTQISICYVAGMIQGLGNDKDDGGVYVDAANLGIRPAMWINLSQIR